ncbi:LLM class flavin-dependent oxidoreductase [Winogradskya consettensis]|uniref:FMN-linked alkanal monooxygenase n=1 Tax=Winogradskya consettensis TaxID=113560 RepID=A0A919SW40_9ACTN|nr:MsnO8 family LLM class oxidoreductase [Actinoplanes consettensis]GIM79935.1 FMN-linked alkanal monooxygenase [Actinoplanes consettensis]
MSASPPVRLSVLDTTLIGRTPESAFADTIALARYAERLGYTRYWMAEHHGAPGVGSSAPAITAGAIAAATARIHVGSGGVMLPNHVPLVVAEQFGTLAALYPGRIDLGVGRAAPEPRTRAMLARDLVNYPADDFAGRVAELIGSLTQGFVSPRATQPPSVWILGSSSAGASLAATLGVPFAFAHHFGRGDAAAAIEHYRRHFQPSTAFPEPYAMVTLLTVVADTDAAAARLAGSADLMFRSMVAGRPILLPSPEQVDTHDWTAEDLAFAEQRRRGQAIGGPETVRDVIAGLLARTGADELMVTSQMYHLADRMRSLELTARQLPVPA